MQATPFNHPTRWDGSQLRLLSQTPSREVSEKNEESYHVTSTLIRTLLSFEILRSVHTFVRGSRKPFRKIPQGDFIDDCRLNASQACVR